MQHAPLVSHVDTDAISHIDSSRFERRSLTRLIDPHVHFPSLAVLENELRTAAQKNDERLPEIHGKWLEVCRAKECSKEEVFEAWERPINALRTSAISNWYTTTGWQVYFTEG